MSTPDGGPAFPQHLTFSPNGEAVLAGCYFSEGAGMTLRDYFAAAALTGGLMQYRESDDYAPWMHASEAYAIADAMLAERAKNGGAK